MAPTSQCLASVARSNLTTTLRPSAAIPKFLLPTVGSVPVRFASQKKHESKGKGHKTFRFYDRSHVEEYSLCDAIRYIRATEVGRPPSSIKYELAVRMRSLKNGPVVRSRIRLPHPVVSDTRIGVICPDGSPLAEEVLALGAVVAGEQTIFDMVRAGDIPFNKLICHTGSEAALKKSGLARVLGPKGLMPSQRTKTITSDVKTMIRDMAGAQDYREKDAVVRLAIGQIDFSPEMLSNNIKSFITILKEDMSRLDSKVSKKIEEVVLSATHSPGFSLDGSFKATDEMVQPQHLVGAM